MLNFKRLDYVELFIKVSQKFNSPLSVLSLCFLGAARIAPIITLSPFFGGRILPNPAKVAMALAFLSIVLPKLLVSLEKPVPFDESLIILFLKEVIIGVIIGFFAGLPFQIVSSSGVLIDHQRGAASLMTNDPTIQNQSSPIGTLYNLLLICLFFAMEGPFYILQGLFDSYDIIPCDRFAWPAFLTEQSFVYEKLVKALYIFVSLTLQLAAPQLIAILMTDTFLGIINRLAPQVQITFLGMGLKSWLALLLVCIGIFPFIDQLTKQMTSWLLEIFQIIHAFGQKGPYEIPIETLPQLIFKPVFEPVFSILFNRLLA